MGGSFSLHFVVELDYRIICINKNRSGANVIMLRPQQASVVSTSLAANDTPKQQLRCPKHELNSDKIGF
jgi:hypothetical protein